MTVALAAAATWSAGVAAGGPSPLGEEFQINTTTEGWQGGTAVAMSAARQFVVVWSTDGGSADGILGQRYVAPPVFTDGFESSDTSAWTQTVP